MIAVPLYLSIMNMKFIIIYINSALTFFTESINDGRKYARHNKYFVDS